VLPGWTPYAARVLIGREPERARIGALLEAALASRSGALVIRGEPGIGKTALLGDARAQASDMHVLTAQGLESESELPFAGLHQLLRPALHLIEELPRPQALALGGALGLAEHSGDDRFLISAACLTLLSELSEDRPVLCVIDDAHWLDTSSSDALVFVARRLGAEGIAMLFATRDREARRFDAHGLPELLLGNLDSSSAADLLGSQYETLDDRVRDLLVERANGNALLLVELPTALSPGQLSGAEPLSDDIPLTRDVEDLFLTRVRTLPEPTQRLVLLVAAETTGALAPVLRAAEASGIDIGAMAAAEQAGVLVVRGATVEVRHPLVRSAVYGAASWSERRSAHLALSAAFTDGSQADQRVWHRAAAVIGTDDEVARELESAASRARQQSGHGAAAAALERAARLSSDTESRARRLVAAADAAWHAGQPDRASALLDEATPIASDPRTRVECAHLRGVIAFWCGRLLDASALLIAESDGARHFDAVKALEMLFDAGEAAGWSGDSARMAEVGRHASELPRDDLGTEGFLADLLVAVGSLFEGKSTDEVPLVLDVVARADEVDEPRWLVWAASAAGVAGDQAREEAILGRATAIARGSGAIDTLSHVLVTAALRRLLGGRHWAYTEAAEGLTLAREAGLPNAAIVHSAVLAYFAAIRGDDDVCRAYATEVGETALLTDNGFANSIAAWSLGLLDLGRGRPQETITRLEAIRGTGPGVGHPYIAVMHTPDLVEACARCGRRELAVTALASLESFAVPEGPEWASALVARCRGLLAEDPDEAEAEFVDALRLHADSDRSFDRGRTALVYGEFLRRERRRTEARAQLRAALAEFENLGAEPWVERARSELRASGETARKRDPSTIDQLTPQELQIASLVAQGLSNKEVAAQLFLSPRTIDYHLRNVFAKLGITSRTQLAGLALEREAVASVTG
jgi:DNA-binding CsgD family transcriptional regulator